MGDLRLVTDADESLANSGAQLAIPHSTFCSTKGKHGSLQTFTSRRQPVLVVTRSEQSRTHQPNYDAGEVLYPMSGKEDEMRYESAALHLLHHARLALRIYRSATARAPKRLQAARQSYQRRKADEYRHACLPTWQICVTNVHIHLPNDSADACPD